MKDFIDIVAKLRAPDGCPWDIKQTHPSLIPYLLEETWEVINEIEQGNYGNSLKEELGDVLLQIVLHSQIAKEKGKFTFEDVVEAISTKMVSRHPHVFEKNNNELSENELRKQWREIKASEKKPKSIDSENTPGAPALLNALTISKYAAGLGFEWKTPWDVLAKVEEELQEVREEMEKGNTEKIEEEIGDLLFSITNLARVYHIHPEIALKKGNDKFIKRFKIIERAIIKAKEDNREISVKEMNDIWEKTKQC